MPVIVYQGKRGAFSELAAQRLFSGAAAEFVGHKEYREMFEALDGHRADYLIVPIENTTAGSVYNYYDLLLEFSLRCDIVIVRELKMKIRHNLIGVRALPSTPSKKCVRITLRSDSAANIWQAWACGLSKTSIPPGFWKP